MGRYATGSGHKDEFKQVSKGSHVVRCYQIIDLGWQKTGFQNDKGEEKVSPQIFMNFEVPGEEIEIDGIKKPMTIGKFYTNSLHEKSNLRQDLESWGFDIEDDPQTGMPFPFDLAQCLERPGLASVTEKNGKNRIASISALPKGMECPAQFNETVQFWLDEPNWDMFETLPEWFQNKIKESKDYEKARRKEHDPMPSLGDDIPWNDKKIPF